MTTPPRGLEIRLADLANDEDARAVIELLDMYAREHTGQNRPLDADARNNAIPGLRSQPGTRIFLAWLEAQPVGLAVCFRGFSTFRGRPLLNVHDLAVVPQARGRGVGKALLDAVERDARSSGCCRVTLEVQAKNDARRLYARCGFTGSEGAASQFFCTKELE